MRTRLAIDSPHAIDAAPWTAEERSVLDTLTSPAAIQTFLDGIPYSTDPIYRSPRSVLRDRKAHCFDGAVFAAAALRRLGHRPLIIDLRAWRDDDHVLALHRFDGHVGCVSKSNVSLLRFREPVFRSIRELVMSYFEFYFNVESQKALREYSVPIDLAQFDARGWTHDDAVMDVIATRLDTIHHHTILTPAMIANLTLTDQRTYASCLLGSDDAGLYKPPPE